MCFDTIYQLPIKAKIQLKDCSNAKNNGSGICQRVVQLISIAVRLFDL